MVHTQTAHLHLAKYDTYKSGGRALYKQARNTLIKEIKVAKRNRRSWKTGPQPTTLPQCGEVCNTSPATEVHNPLWKQTKDLADEMNKFFCRVEMDRYTPLTHPNPETRTPSHASPLHSPSSPTPPSPSARKKKRGHLSHSFWGQPGRRDGRTCGEGRPTLWSKGRPMGFPQKGEVKRHWRRLQ